MDLENWGLSERGGGLSYRKREINTRRFWNAYKHRALLMRLATYIGLWQCKECD